jgi:hypothetical protein
MGISEEEEEEEEAKETSLAEGLNERWLEQKKRAETERLAGDVEVDLSGYTCIAAKEMSDGDGRDVLQAATHHAREATRLILLAAQSGCHRRQELLRAKAQAMARLHGPASPGEDHSADGGAWRGGIARGC